MFTLWVGCKAGLTLDNHIREKCKLKLTLEMPVFYRH